MRIPSSAGSLLRLLAGLSVAATACSDGCPHHQIGTFSTLGVDAGEGFDGGCFALCALVANGFGQFPDAGCALTTLPDGTPGVTCHQTFACQ